MYAQEFLEDKQVSAEEVVDARKEKIDENAAWALLKDAASISIAKGKTIQNLTPADGKELILKHAMGPSGNLRAPTYRVKDQYIIGFNADLYEDWVK
jgi:hypothetical protein